MKALSLHQHHLARLAAAGMTNEEIAAELAVSLSTVKNQMTTIYCKLGIVPPTGRGRERAERLRQALEGDAPKCGSNGSGDEGGSE